MTIMASVLFRPSAGQDWIPYAIGAGGQSGYGISGYTLGQPFVSPGDQSAGLCHFMWIPQDTTFCYNIGDIPDKSVFHNESCRFRIYWKEHPGALFSYLLMDRYDTSILFQQETGKALFEYSPIQEDLSAFSVRFTATDGDDTLRQVVQFTPVPPDKPENEMLRYVHDPSMFDTLLVMKTWRKTDDPMNFTGKDTVVRIDIIGKTVIFKDGTEPFHYGNISNLEELNIYAVNLVIRDSLILPQTRINIWCENLSFEDNDGIHACFNTTPREPLVSGQTGLHTEPFSCYLDRLYTSGNRKRFFLTGGTGSPSMIEGVSWTAPGGGGNGADLHSNLNLISMVVNEGGSYGKPHEWVPFPSGPRGSKGSFQFETNRYRWLHPNTVRLMLQVAREQYISGLDQESYGICNKYTGLIEAYRKTIEWTDDNTGSTDLEQLLYSFTSIKDQMDDGLDYFGNPRGWAPLLSFEANLENYKKETEYAIRVLYLNKWMTDKASSLALKQEAAELLKNENLEEIMRLKAEYSESYLDYSPTLLEFRSLSEKLDTLTLAYNQKIGSLLAVAENNVSKSWENILRQSGNIAAQVCKMIPSPKAQAIGTGLEIASSLDYEDPLSMNNLDVVFSKLEESLEGFSGISDAVSGMIGGLEPESMADPEEKKALINAAAIIEEMSPDDPLNIGLSIKELTFPNDMVKAEFEKLKNGCPLLRDLTDSMDLYSGRKGEAAEKLRFIRYQLTRIPREITGLLMTCDAMDDILLSTENIVDPRAMSYLNDMKNSAWERMLRYHYYMALAYQYRFLKPYDHPLDLQPLFESFDTLARQGADLTPDEYNALLPVFQDQLAQISDEIYTRFNDGIYNELNTRINYTLSKDQLEVLNNTGELKINLWNSGKIPLDHVDCRITGIALEESSFAVSTDTILQDATLTVMMAHSGNSSLIHPQTGEHLIFTQYNKDVSEYYNSNRMSPLGWAQKYFFDNGEIITIQRSLASMSLIKSILDVADDNDLMIFTRPAAEAEIKIITSLHTGEQENMHVKIDHLTLTVYIDYQTVTAFSNILVNSSNGLMPLIQCSKPDMNGRDYGRGNFTLSYNRNAGTIMFTAPATHGIYIFDKWLKTTNSVTEEVRYRSVTINALYHNWLTAVYRLNVPSLDVVDTVYAEWNQDQVDLPVKNANPCDHLAMEWFGVTTEGWMNLKEGSDRGVEEGMLKLELSSNEGPERTGKLIIYAFNAMNPEKEITVIQKERIVGIPSIKGPGPSLKVYPNPADDEIRIELAGQPAARNFVLSIHAPDGRCVYQQACNSLESGTVSIPVGNLFPGMYILKAASGSDIYYTRFTKK